MQRILVLRGGALGDFLVTLPALGLLRERWPQARIELVGNATAAALALRRGIVDAVHSQDEGRWRALYSDSSLPAALAVWLGEFDLVLSYWPDPAAELSRHFPRHAAQRFLSAAALPLEGPAAAHYARPLAALGLSGTRWVYPLAAIAAPPRGGGRRIAVHPGSGSPRKNWPLAHWVTLLAQLKERLQVEFMVVAGPAEAPGALADLGPLAHDWPLEQLLAGLSDCDFFIGHDSGVSHLAAAAGLPSLLLFGPTDPAFWAPPSPRITVLRNGPDLATISVAEVVRSVSQSFK